MGLVAVLTEVHGGAGLDGQHGSVGQTAVAGDAGDLFFHMQSMIRRMNLADVLIVFAKVFGIVTFEAVFVGYISEKDRPALATA